jgi:hypothetical protein
MADSDRKLRVIFKDGRVFTSDVPSDFEVAFAECGWFAVPGGYVNANEVLSIQLCEETRLLSAVERRAA